jgi:hypothetical protein
MSEDIRYRQNRYLLMMGIRTLCLILSVVLFLNHLAWLSAAPVAGAIILPYIAVVFANGGREPDNVRGFMEHRMNLPARREPPADGDAGPSDGNTASSRSDTGSGGNAGPGDGDAGPGRD